MLPSVKTAVLSNFSVLLRVPYPPTLLLQAVLEMSYHLKLLSMLMNFSWPDSSYLQEMGTVHAQIWGQLGETLEK